MNFIRVTDINYQCHRLHSGTAEPRFDQLDQEGVGR